MSGQDMTQKSITQQKRRTKILATLGPATDAPACSRNCSVPASTRYG